MSLVGAALGQVYLSRAPEAHRRGALAETTSEMLTYLLRVGVGPLLAAGIAAPALFEPIFGAGWQRAGHLVSWMTPWFVLQFLAVPVGMALHITGHQREALALQFTGLVVRVGSVLVAAHWIGGYVAEAYAMSGAALYVLYLYVVARITGVSARDGKRMLASALPHLAAWVGLGVLVAVVARWVAGS
jgi:O-antigen/teichoic acid export membrane protein